MTRLAGVPPAGDGRLARRWVLRRTRRGKSPAGETPAVLLHREHRPCAEVTAEEVCEAWLAAFSVIANTMMLAATAKTAEYPAVSG